MTKNYFKLDKKDEIMFNQDYIMINGALLFHKSVAVIGNDLLQDKIEKNIGFNYSCEYKTFKDELPNCKALFSEEFTTHPDLFGEYVNTGLCQLKRTKHGVDYALFYSAENKKIIGFNKRYADFILENGLYIWGKDGDLYSLILTDSKKNVLGLICGCKCWQNHDTAKFFDNIFIHDRNLKTETELKDLKNSSLPTNYVVVL